MRILTLVGGLANQFECITILVCIEKPGKIDPHVFMFR